MATHVVRPAAPEQAGLVARLLHGFNTEFAAPTPTVEEFARRFEVLLRRDDVLVLLALFPGAAEGSDAAAEGFAPATVRPSAYCDAGVAALEELYVRAHLRGAGAGTALVAELLARLRARGVDELQVNVDSVDADARRFYERHGFSNVEASGPGEAAQQSRLLLYERQV